MSLTSLTHIVTTKFTCDLEESLNKIERLYNIVNTVSFTKRTLLANGINERDASLYIQSLKDADCIETEYSYECQVENGMELAILLPFNCELCAENVDYPNANHIIEEIYLLKDVFVDDYLQSKKEKLYSVVHKEFIPILELLLHNKNNIIPFLGSGVSVPFKLPDWKNMFMEFEKYVTEQAKLDYVQLVQRGDFFGAVTLMLLGNSPMFTDGVQIQKHIASLFKNVNINIPDSKHNLRDIANLEADFYLTTNYDNILINFFNGRIVNPICLPEVEDMHELFKEQLHRVVHVHGILDKPSTMIVTKEQYEALYSNQMYKDKIKAIMGHKQFLFIGYSFNDDFFVNLYQDVICNLGGEHYIIAPNINQLKVMQFGKLNLRAISLNLPLDYSTQDYVNALKVILKALQP